MTPTAAQAAAQKAHAAASPGTPAPDAKPAFRGVVPTATTEVRAASHRLVDQLLGALTGRPGGFASEMTYAEKVGRWRRVFAIDSDGFDLRAIGPTNATAISPAFGPGGQRLLRALDRLLAVPPRLRTRTRRPCRSRSPARSWASPSAPTATEWR